MKGTLQLQPNQINGKLVEKLAESGICGPLHQWTSNHERHNYNQTKPNIYGGLSSYKTNNFFVGVLLYTALLSYRVGHECSIRTQPLHKILTLKTIFKNKIKNKNNIFK